MNNNIAEQSGVILSVRGSLMARIPHYILIDGRMVGIAKGRDIVIMMPPGNHAITIRSMYKFLESTTDVDVPDNGLRRVIYSDRDRLWNWIFNIDLVVWLLKTIFAADIPSPWGLIYEIVSDTILVAWIVRTWLIRKHFFRKSLRKIRVICSIRENKNFRENRSHRFHGSPQINQQKKIIQEKPV